MRKLVVCCVAVLCSQIGLLAEQLAGFSVHDLVAMDRISDPQVSPDGRLVVFVRRQTDLEADRGRTDLWLVESGGAGLRRMTGHEAGDSNPRWAPDGRSLYFLSSRSGSSQVWRIAVDGGEAERVTDLPLDVGTLLVSPDGRHLALTLEVFPDCDSLTCTVERLDAVAAGKASGRIYERIFARHWDTWKDGRRSHLFVVAIDEAAAIDLTPGLDADRRSPGRPTSTSTTCQSTARVRRPA
jgi:dipeptidyl aminopeptidase/acylaminoacyl peptidase